MYLIRSVICVVFFGGLLMENAVAQTRNASISIGEDQSITLNAGILKRVLCIGFSGVSTQELSVSGRNILAGSAPEIAFRVHRAVPNRQPEGFDVSVENGSGTIVKDDLAETDELHVVNGQDDHRQRVLWEQVVMGSASDWGETFAHHKIIRSSPKPDVQELRIRYRSAVSSEFSGLAVDMVYQIHQEYSAIRKWVEITNNSSLWLKFDSLIIDDVRLASPYLNVVDMTPGGRGAVSSIRAFSNAKQTYGVLQVSEIPSALRMISEQGAMGYNMEHFEWVLGPAEQFISEPVFSYAYEGPADQTQSSVSTALDREVESRFQRYLHEVVGVKTFDAASSAPLWCSWSNYGPLINDDNMKEAADIAAGIGIKTLLLDAGWSEATAPNAIARFSVVPDPTNFPAFNQTTSYIRSLGLNIGLWVSCFRHPEHSADLQALPLAHSFPKVERDGALAMSYASKWRSYYAYDLVSLYDRYHATYFKQDLTNIKFGDIAKGHDSRTQKESLLRGLRGLFSSQDEAARMAPEIRLELTHEIYWGTPGTPCDVAALKHAHYFHVPPNDYAGAGNPRRLASKQNHHNVDSIRARLINGCWNARQQFFAHRGLPLQSIEYYGAATINLGGSLTPQVQQRQLCSWFMGAPSVYAGDLTSLSEENRTVYKDGFALLNRLNSAYGVYSYFQFSGVPAPTDTDWHWWGKLNENGYGAVVVMRGKGGLEQRNINIPWVQPGVKYQVRACFEDRILGEFSGNDLINGGLTLSLDPYSQEILEIMPFAAK